MTLSLGLPPLDVIQHTALWSPDFPQTYTHSCAMSAIVFHTYNRTIIAYAKTSVKFPIFMQKIYHARQNTKIAKYKNTEPIVTYIQKNPPIPYR